MKRADGLAECSTKRGRSKVLATLAGPTHTPSDGPAILRSDRHRRKPADRSRTQFLQIANGSSARQFLLAQYLDLRSSFRKASLPPHWLRVIADFSNQQLTANLIPTHRSRTTPVRRRKPSSTRGKLKIQGIEVDASFSKAGAGLALGTPTSTPS